VARDAHKELCVSADVVRSRDELHELEWTIACTVEKLMAHLDEEQPRRAPAKQALRALQHTHVKPAIVQFQAVQFRCPPIFACSGGLQAKFGLRAIPRCGDATLGCRT